MTQERTVGQEIDSARQLVDAEVEDFQVFEYNVRIKLLEKVFTEVQILSIAVLHSQAAETLDLLLVQHNTRGLVAVELTALRLLRRPNDHSLLTHPQIQIAPEEKKILPEFFNQRRKLGRRR